MRFSWTSYVEKSGSGTGEIIDKCRDHGLATPIYDPTEGFFKTIIWRNGYGPMSKKSPSQGPRKGPERALKALSQSTESAPSQGAESRGRVKGPSQGGRVKALGQGTKSALSRGTKSGDVGFNNGEQIILYCKVPRSAVEIMTLFGRSDRTKFKKAVLNSLMSDMLLEYTIPEKPNSRLQKYRLTAEGRRLAASLAKKKVRR